MLVDDGAPDGLKPSGHARLKDALNLSLSIENRFDLVHDAAHAAGLAALGLEIPINESLSGISAVAPDVGFGPS